MPLTPLLKAVTARTAPDLSSFPSSGAGALSKLAVPSSYQPPFEGTSMLRGGSPRGTKKGETEGTLAMLMAGMQKGKEEAAQQPPAETGAEDAIRSLLGLRQGSTPGGCSAYLWTRTCCAPEQ